jgi:hypothetical protein
VGEIVQRAAGPIPDLPAGYAELLTELKRTIRAAQVKAALAVNREMVATLQFSRNLREN